MFLCDLGNRNNCGAMRIVTGTMGDHEINLQFESRPSDVRAVVGLFLLE